MNELFKVAALSKEILNSANTMQRADALIAKWSDKDLGSGPQRLITAADLEARNQVYGWGK